MEYKIVFRKRFTTGLLNVLEYLEREWGKKVADDFLVRITEATDLLRSHPHTGAPSKKVANARGLAISKHNRLFYRIEKIP